MLDTLVSLGIPKALIHYILVAQGVLIYFIVVGLLLFITLRKLPKRWTLFFQEHHLRGNVWRLFGVAYVTYYLHVAKAVVPEYTYIFEHLWTIFASASVIVGTVLAFSCINIGTDIYETYPVSKRIPIRSYTQVIKILFGVGSGIIVVSIFLNKSPLAFFTGLGATIALITVLFKDTISGFMASIQLSSYDMVRIGDWITIPKFGVDGNVKEIALTTVKIENFDRTISMIPTASLLTESVKNWRGMFDAGGRRIKRSVPIDMESIRFCSQEEVKKLQTMFPQLTAVYDEPVTNLTLFREYIEAYLKASPDLHQEGFLFLIRELDPTEKGLPLEFYVFTKETRWVQHEKVQANIIDHTIATLPLFGLNVFQTVMPTNNRITG
jgi:miniconductance mechanosensitive channel